MSVVYTLPPKSARLFSAASVISTTVDGNFWNIDGKFKMFNAKPGYVYLVDTYSFVTGVSQENYVTATTQFIPIVTLENSIGQSLNGLGRSVVSYCADTPYGFFYSSDTQVDIYCHLKGIVQQTSELLGDNIFKVAISFNIYEISSTEMSGAYRDSISARAKDVMRGTLS
jgi:hypothetical protein